MSGSGDGLQEAVVRSDHLLRQGQHQAAVPRHATSDVMLVEEDLNLLEINDQLLGPKNGNLKWSLTRCGSPATGEDSRVRRSGVASAAASTSARGPAKGGWQANVAAAARSRLSRITGVEQRAVRIRRPLIVRGMVRPCLLVMGSHSPVVITHTMVENVL